MTRIRFLFSMVILLLCWSKTAMARGLQPDDTVAVLPSVFLVPTVGLKEWLATEKKIRGMLLENKCCVVTDDDVAHALKKCRITPTLHLLGDEWSQLGKVLQCQFILRVVVKKMSIKTSENNPKLKYEGMISGVVQVFSVDSQLLLPDIPFGTELLSIDRTVFPNGIPEDDPAVAKKYFLEKMLEVAFNRKIWQKLR